LLSRDGVRLQKVESNRTSFIWSVTCREIAGKQEIISGDQNGRLSSHTIGYSRVHGMFKKLYASREKLTSISITELNLPDKPAIFVNCREMISKIALSEDILVAQAKDKIKIWQKNNSTLKYDTVSSFAAPENCNMIVCGAMHVIGTVSL
jgi:intraflagellar transport protein 122